MYQESESGEQGILDILNAALQEDELRRKKVEERKLRKIRREEFLRI